MADYSTYETKKLLSLKDKINNELIRARHYKEKGYTLERERKRCEHKILSLESALVDVTVELVSRK